MADEVPVTSEQSIAWLDRGRRAAAVATTFMLRISTSGTAISMAALVLLTLLSARAKDWLATVRPSSRNRRARMTAGFTR
ncbi:hypothetical protein MTX26_23640 [Bradyrhizobium sp. ISRA443]|uniref:hypothetical protein n=1 Tax=unclassified Bradyrhizobium TaxID=2631580 RepID=UPI00247B194F|nr:MULTISPECIES: hypothetical protein [unclassified Bradyrhizobium]WGR92909.1 hypothetical protein MTX20_34505 [Bradyrhizobium sp. ISRA435]WGR97407.1 hypothetical protein MTX23_23640 [Bradyrhizobium sp. ISRA436]WGS04295.1 hypothetical protein MTX18_23635 [Bradyrhizobium sp. ISRA437]WGS11179.1 hypothetical protein MTX26_23640 [Bradyrhizobium sp. ISRA443]